jgi:hypothetical protein
MSSKMQSFERENPAGLDKVLLAGLKAGHDSVLRQFSMMGIRLPDLWSGPDGVGAVMGQVFREQGVPNQQFGELVTPRKLAERAGLIRCPKKRTLKRRAGE